MLASEIVSIASFVSSFLMGYLGGLAPDYSPKGKASWWGCFFVICLDMRFHRNLDFLSTAVTFAYLVFAFTVGAGIGIIRRPVQ